MEENKYLRFCPKHGNLGEEALICPECGRETVLSDITRDCLIGWTFSSDEKEKLFSHYIDKAFKVGLEKIVHDLRSGKKGKVENAIKLLMWRTEREDYIEEVVKWSEDLKSPVTMFLGRCAYDKVRPHLNFKNYNCLDKYSAQLFLPLFLERYKHQQPLPCERCGQEANRLFIKIQSEEKPQLSVRHVGHVAQQLPYTGLAIPHAYCDECALKNADLYKRLQGLSDEEKIRAWMDLNVDSYILTCGDKIGVAGFFHSVEIEGFSYDYLISPAAAEEMTNNETDRVVLAAMIECALDIKEKLEEME